MAAQPAGAHRGGVGRPGAIRQVCHGILWRTAERNRMRNGAASSLGLRGKRRGVELALAHAGIAPPDLMHARTPGRAGGLQVAQAARAALE